VGAACSQNITDPALGKRLLELVGGGSTAAEAMDQVTRETPHIFYRQLSVVDREGNVASFSGEGCLGTNRTVHSSGAVAAGNLLASGSVPAAMIAAFDAGAGKPLGDRLVEAMQAAIAEGGEVGPVHSAGLVIVDQVSWPTTDLRVDWSDDPIHDLAVLWRLWRPQIDAYLTRALNPAESPSYGVPGDSR
jgi:uncharacterized Ntn-hydrolase superfamily protein